MERTQPGAVPEGHRPASHARRGRGEAEVQAQVCTMLGEIADRLERSRPDQRLTATGRLAVLQATTMDPVLGRALQVAAPEIISPVTRTAYAARLREIAAVEPSLLDRYAAATQRCRDIAKEIGFRDSDTDPRWRAADRKAEAIWKEALAAGHTADELTAASRAKTDDA